MPTPAKEPTGHQIDLEHYRRPGGFASAGFCGSKSPHGEWVWCRRLAGHQKRDDKGHAAFVHKISTPEYWP